MSELIQQNDNRDTIRWKLLTGASALVLTAYVSSVTAVRAEDTDRPMLWVELGGQMELMQGTSRAVTAPFMFIEPQPAPYADDILTEEQRPLHLVFGAESKITFQPENSNWLFAASVRYGRAHARRHVHHQSSIIINFPSSNGFHQGPATQAPFADVEMPTDEHHSILDFTAGRDVGIGFLSENGSSNISMGVRIAQISAHLATEIHARPTVNFPTFFGFPFFNFKQYTLYDHADRSFHGIGPSLSWEASAALAGNSQEGELVFDWGLNASVLFGRQKTKTDHSTRAQLRDQKYHGGADYKNLYPPLSRDNSLRSRSVTVPNVGGFVGLSMKYPNFKFSLGYRGDVFLKAMDTGIDVRKDSNLTFNGPYASISIGLGD